MKDYFRIICAISIIFLLVIIGNLSDDKIKKSVKIDKSSNNSSRIIRGELIYQNTPPSDNELKNNLVQYLSKINVKDIDKNKITFRKKKNTLGSTHIRFSVLCNGNCQIMEGHEDPNNPDHVHILSAGGEQQQNQCASITGADECNISAHSTQTSDGNLNCSLPEDTTGYNISRIPSNGLVMNNVENLNIPCTCTAYSCYVSNEPGDGFSASQCNSPNSPITLTGCEKELCKIPTNVPDGVIINASPDNIPTLNVEGETVGNRRYLKNETDNMTGVLYSCATGYSIKNTHNHLIDGRADERTADERQRNLRATCDSDGGTLIMDGCSLDCSSIKTDTSCDADWCEADGNMLVQENNLQSFGNLFDVNLKCADDYSWSDDTISGTQMLTQAFCNPSPLNRQYNHDRFECVRDCIDPVRFPRYNDPTFQNECRPNEEANREVCEEAGTIPLNHDNFYGQWNDANGEHHVEKPNMKYECLQHMDGDARKCSYHDGGMFRESSHGGNRSSVPSLFDMQDYIECNPKSYIPGNTEITASVCNGPGESYILEGTCNSRLIRVPEDRSITRTNSEVESFPEGYIDENGETIDSTNFSNDINSLKGNIRCNTGYEGSPQIIGPDDEGTPSDYGSFMTYGCWPTCDQRGCINHQSENTVIKSKDDYINEILQNINSQRDMDSGVITVDQITYFRQFYYNNKIYNEIQIIGLDEHYIFPVDGDCDSFENIPSCSNIRVCGDTTSTHLGQENCIPRDKFNKFFAVYGNSPPMEVDNIFISETSDITGGNLDIQYIPRILTETSFPNTSFYVNSSDINLEVALINIELLFMGITSPYDVQLPTLLILDQDYMVLTQTTNSIEFRFLSQEPDSSTSRLGSVSRYIFKITVDASAQSGTFSGVYESYLYATVRNDSESDNVQEVTRTDVVRPWEQSLSSRSSGDDMAQDRAAFMAAAGSFRVQPQPTDRRRRTQTSCVRPSNTDRYNIIHENNLFPGSTFDVEVTCREGEGSPEALSCGTGGEEYRLTGC